jgi:Reverse transcriptase (RNA-dependent DNA polymerase)
MADTVMRSHGLSTNSGSLYKIALKSSYVGACVGDLRFCHLNPGSVAQNIDEMQIFFADLSMDIICVSESWLKKHHSYKRFGLNGYKLFRADRSGRRGGGSAVYVNSKHRCKILAQSKADASVNFLFLEITFYGQRVLVGSFYDPPKISGYSQYGPILEELLPKYEHNLFLGDFNVNLLVDSREAQDFCEKLDDHTLFVVSKEPTHFQGDSSTMIDLCLTSFPEDVGMFSQIPLPGIKTGHDLIYGYLRVSGVTVVDQQTQPPKFYRDYRAIDLTKTRCSLESQNFSHIFRMTDPDDQIQYFNSAIVSVFQDNVPLKRCPLKNPDNPWMNFEISRMIAERDIAYNIWDKNRTEENRDRFLQLRKKTTKAIRASKRRLSGGQLNPKLPPKSLWRNLKNMGLKDDPAYESTFSAEELNSYYSSLSSRSPQLSTHSPATHSSDHTDELFSFRNVDDFEVKNAIYSVKSTAIGLDGISLKFIKLILPYILPYITFIFNTILTKSLFPKTWKISKVIPIAKVKDPRTPTDYRPICILSSLSKALEILMKDQIMPFMIRYGFLNRFQSGFRPAHSTTSALLKVTDDFRKACERRLVTVLLLLDFSKAFDSVIHDLLCNKLSSAFKFDSSAVSLIKSYLSDRFQCVSIGEELSSFAPILKGVVQGSILGPILFSIFINDLMNVIMFSQCHMYADDAQLYISGERSDIARTIEKLNADVSSIWNWSQQNGLCLNPDKSQAVIISLQAFPTENIPPIILNGSVVPYYDKVKDLGLILNSGLTWRDQVNSIIQKIYATLRRLWTLADILPISTRKKLVIALINPFFMNYDVIFSKASIGLTNRLRIALNSCARFIFNISPGEHISELAEQILGLPLNKFYSFRICCQMFKIVNNLSPSYLCEKLQVGHSIRTRVLHVPRHTLASTANSFFICGPVMWNRLPISVRNESRYRSFRTACWEFLKSTALPELT